MRSRAACATIAIAIFFAACQPAEIETRKLFAFGTIVTLQFPDASNEQIDAAVNEVEYEFMILDIDWYPWVKPQTQMAGKLFGVNKGIANGWTMDVDPPLAELIRRASEIERLSGGRFNAATGRLSRLWGLADPTNPPDALPKSTDIEALLDAGISSRFLDWDGNTLSSRSRDIEIDLGGIAKGALLSVAANIIRQHRINNAIVDIGGDLTVIGRIHGRPARIGIRSPSKKGVVAWLEVSDGETVVTSGDYERYIEVDGQRYQHILDPRSGYPVSHTSTVTVIHRDPVLADAAATALVVGGIAEFDALCADLGLSEALIIDSAGDLRLTSAMEKRVKWRR